MDNWKYRIFMAILDSVLLTFGFHNMIDALNGWRLFLPRKD